MRPEEQPLCLQEGSLTQLRRNLLSSGAATLLSSAMPVSIILIGSHRLDGGELGRVGLTLWFMSIGALLGVSWAAWLLPHLARRPSPFTAAGVVEGLILSLGGGAVAATVAVVAGLGADLALAAALGASAMGAARVLAAVFQARAEYVRLALVYAAGLLVAIAALSLLLSISADESAVLLPYVAGLLTAAGIAYLMSDAVRAERLPPVALRIALGAWSPILVLAVLDAILWQRSELFFLHMFRSEPEVGQYAAAYSVVATVGLPAAATGAVVVPMLARALSDRPRAALMYGRLWMTASIAFPVLLWGAILSATLLVGSGGSQLSPSPATLCAILAIGTGPAAAGVVASSAFYAAGLIRPMVLVAGAGAFANVGLDILLIPRHGMLGAAAATASVQLAVGAVGFFLAAREFRVDAGLAAGASIALAAGIIGDLALFLVFTGQTEPGLAAFAAAALIMAGIAIGSAWSVRRGAS